MKATGLSRVAKDLTIRRIEQEIKAKPNLFVSRVTSVPASNVDKLRRKLQASGSSYMIVKNSLCRRALVSTHMEALTDSFQGMCGIAFTAGDPVASSKVLMDFAKENEAFKVQGALVNGQFLGADQIKVLASLPAKEVLIARVVGGIQTPLSRFVGVLSGTVRQVLNVLDAIAKKKGTGN